MDIARSRESYLIKNRQRIVQTLRKWGRCSKRSLKLRAELDDSAFDRALLSLLLDGTVMKISGFVTMFDLFPSQILLKG